MSNARYTEYLNSGAWQAKRIKFLATRKQCECCKDEAAAVQVHHLTYERIFNELDSDLMALCRRCHRNAEAAIAKGKIWRRGDTAVLRKITIGVLKAQVRRVDQSGYIARQDAARRAHAQRIQAEAAQKRSRTKLTDSERQALQKEASIWQRAKSR